MNEDIKPDLVHYIPYHAVIRRDRSTTRLRIVYDASAKSMELHGMIFFMPVLRLH